MNWFSAPYSSSEVEISENENHVQAFSRILNNFYLRFPLGSSPFNHPHSPLGAYRKISFEYGLGDKRNKNGLDSHERQSSLHSKKWAEQTIDEFHREIDGTVERLGISMTIVSEAINDAIGTHEWHREPKYKHMMDILLPIYTELRKQGYSPQDLTG